MANIKPLSRGQKLFLQRLLASHVLSSSEATSLYNSIIQTLQNEDDTEDQEDIESTMGPDLEHCLGKINASLVPAFRLEIRTVSLPSSLASHGNGGHEEESGYQKYHAIVNKQNDGPAQKHAASTLGPHDMAFLRLALENIVEDDLEREQARLEKQQQQQAANDNEEEEDEEEEEGDKRSSIGSSSSRRRRRPSPSKQKRKSTAAPVAIAPPVGCTGALNRLDLTNLRTKMEGPHKDKLNIAQTERVIDMMVEEGWLVLGYAPNTDTNNDEDDDNNNNDDNDEDEDDDMEGGGSARKKKRRRSRKKSSPRKKKHSTGRKNYYWIGPRTYMECPDLLIDLGIAKERMPQFIMHHA